MVGLLDLEEEKREKQKTRGSKPGNVQGQLRHSSGKDNSPSGTEGKEHSPDTIGFRCCEEEPGNNH